MNRNELMKAHRTLALGSPEDMQAARCILQLLRRGQITLGLGDVDFRVEILLEDLGVPITYNRRGYSATAKLPNN